MVLLGHSVLAFRSKICIERTKGNKSVLKQQFGAFCDRILWLMVNLLRDWPGHWAG